MSEPTDLQTLPALLDAVAARHPSSEAFISARRRATYAELRDDSIAIGRGLAARGVGRGTRVALLMPNRAEWLATAFGVWRCGGILVPLSTLARPRELAHFLRSADVALLVAVRRFLRHDYQAMLEEIAADAGRAPAPLFNVALPALRQVVWLEDEPADAVRTLAAPGDALGGAWPGVLTARVAPADPATVTFTSGTTSDPKGAVHAHQALCRSANDVGATLGVDASDRIWGYLPFFFNAGLVSVGLATLARGAAIVAMEVFEPGEALDLLEAERCTVFFGWPHQAEALIQHPRFASAKLALHKGVGANVPWAARLYPPDHHAVATWGMTETGPMFTAWPSTMPLEVRASGHGAPVAGREVRICDPESGEPMAVGTAGEICVRGPTLLSHYDGLAPRDCFDAHGYFHTGDLGRLDERGTHALPRPHQGRDQDGGRQRRGRRGRGDAAAPPGRRRGARRAGAGGRARRGRGRVRRGVATRRARRVARALPRRARELQGPAPSLAASRGRAAAAQQRQGRQGRAAGGSGAARRGVGRDAGRPARLARCRRVCDANSTANCADTIAPGRTTQGRYDAAPSRSQGDGTGHRGRGSS